MIDQKTYTELKPVLMDPTEPKVKDPYLVIPNSSDGNLTVVSSGKNGSEYNKTYGLTHTYPGVVTLHCLFGHGVIMTQRYGPEGDVKEVKVHALRPGTTVEIPSSTSYSLTNTGRGLLVTIDNFQNNAKHISTEFITEHKGLAYYVVERKGEVAFDKNPNYRFHPQLVME